MRAVICEEKDGITLLESLELQRMKQANVLTRLNPEDPADQATVQSVHRAFHYVVVQWLQDQGFKVTR